MYASPVPKAAEVANQPAEETEKAEQVAAAETESQGNTEAKKMSWDEIMADPDYKEAMSDMIRKRTAKSKESEDRLKKLAPALEVLGKALKVDISDTDALVKAVTQNTKFYEDQAASLGVPVETAMKIEQLEREKAQREQADKDAMEERMFREHLAKLHKQGEQLKETFPNFDLQRELQNPVFMRMTGPNMGISVQDAYYAVHREEIQKASMQIAAQKVSEKLSNSIQSGKHRPIENGAQNQPASVSTFDYRNMTQDQRSQLKKQIMQAAARGEKLYPSR